MTAVDAREAPAARGTDEARRPVSACCMCGEDLYTEALSCDRCKRRTYRTGLRLGTISLEDVPERYRPKPAVPAGQDRSAAHAGEAR